MKEQTEKGKIGEKFANEIAYKSFLKYWCYPNPKDENGDKKEICDLLIIFKDTIIIFCVKNCDFKDDYKRYFRKTIEKDINQINGAERKLTNKTEIYIKHPDRPTEKINKSKIKRVFRVVVHLAEAVQFYPFSGISKEGKFIHVFDKETFSTIVSELDTIPDFIEYLEKKSLVFNNSDVLILPKDEYDFDEATAKQFFDYTSNRNNEKKQILISGSECDLLATYLRNEHQFPDLLSSDEYDALSLQLDGAWNEFTTHKQVLLKKNENKVSYFIDELVAREVLTNIDNKMGDKIAQELLSFNRLARRSLAKSFFDFFDKYQNCYGNMVARRFSGDVDGVGVTFFFYPSEMDEENVNTLIELAMDSFYVYNGYKIEKMIVIATTNKMKQFKFALDENLTPFDTQTEEAIMEDAKKLGWFSNLQSISFHESEFPEVD